MNDSENNGHGEDRGGRRDLPLLATKIQDRTSCYQQALEQVALLLEKLAPEQITVGPTDTGLLTAVQVLIHNGPGARVALELEMCLERESPWPLIVRIYRIDDAGNDGDWQFFDVNEAISKFQNELNHPQTATQAS